MPPCSLIACIKWPAIAELATLTEQRAGDVTEQAHARSFQLWVVDDAAGFVDALDA